MNDPEVVHFANCLRRKRARKLVSADKKAVKDIVWLGKTGKEG
jgi:hypothetical protein